MGCTIFYRGYIGVVGVCRDIEGYVGAQLSKLSPQTERV